jgi:hypothetical protein
VSVLSAGCVLWLRVLQPFFVALAVLALGYQVWLVRQRPPQRRTRKVLAILWSSIALNVLLFAGWVALSLRYG